MKNYEELKKLMDDAKVAKAKAESENFHRKLEERKLKISSFVDSIMEKYEKIIEADLINEGCTRFELYTDGYHFKNAHVISAGQLPVYDCVIGLRSKFIEKGFKDYMIDFSASSIQVSIH